MTAPDDVSLGDDRALRNGDTVRATTTVTLDASGEIVDQKTTEVETLLAGLGKRLDPMQEADALVADWYQGVRAGPDTLTFGDLHRLILAVAKEFTAKAALAATCDRLLLEVADRDAKIARQRHDLELSGRAIDRTLGVIPGVTRVRR
jgi:hypothetical protein